MTCVKKQKLFLKKRTQVYCSCAHWLQTMRHIMHLHWYKIARSISRLLVDTIKLMFYLHLRMLSDSKIWRSIGDGDSVLVVNEECLVVWTAGSMRRRLGHSGEAMLVLGSEKAHKIRSRGSQPPY